MQATNYNDMTDLELQQLVRNRNLIEPERLPIFNRNDLISILNNDDIQRRTANPLLDRYRYFIEPINNDDLQRRTVNPLPVVQYSPPITPPRTVQRENIPKTPYTQRYGQNNFNTFREIGTPPSPLTFSPFGLPTIMSPSPPPSPYRQEINTNITQPPQIPIPARTPNRVPVVPITDANNPTTPTIPRVPIVATNRPTIPVVPIVATNRPTIPAVPIVGTNRQTIPVVPIVGTNRPTIPAVPIVGTNRPTIPAVPIVETNRQTIPVVPIAGTNRQTIPVVPIVGTNRQTIPVVPIVGTNRQTIPVVPIVGTNRPIIPGLIVRPTIPIVPIVETNINTNTIPIVPIVGTNINNRINGTNGTNLAILPLLESVRVNVSENRTNTINIPPVPIIPTNDYNLIVNRMGGDMSAMIRNRLRNSTFDVYDFEWRQNYNIPTIGQRQRQRQRQRNKREAEELESVLQTTLLVRNANGNRKYYMEYIMNSEPNLVAEIFTLFGLNKLKAAIDVYYNLLWYLNVAHNATASGLNKEEISYISGLEEPELLNILGPRYRGPHDKASLIFAILSGKSSPRPDIIDIPRYEDVMVYPPNVIWVLAQKLYGIIDSDNQIISLYPPYVHVALQPPSGVEQIVSSVNENNVDQFAEQYGVVFRTQNPINNNQQKKVKYFINEIKNYDLIITRPQNLMPPPILVNKTKDQVRNILSQYTLKEIVNAYEPIGVWADREGIIDVIGRENRGGSMWSWRHKYCNNDNTENVIMAEKHGDMDKDDPGDPTLSYGVQMNYRCYQVSELVAFFDVDINRNDDIFRFRVPDWKKNAVNPTTGELDVEEFPIDSIRQLRRLLVNPPSGYQVNDLLAQVDRGLTAANDAAIRVRALKRYYDEDLTPEQRYLVRLYLAWLFTYGMWMRFWKGPGHRWPTEWIEGGGYQDLCEAGRRDEHIFIQQSVRAAIIEQYEQTPLLKIWIENLPLLDYNFITGQVKIATQGATTILTILDKIQLGDFCMAHGSDLILKTSYYLIASILNLKTGADFNAFINQMLPDLLNMERQIIDNQLVNIKNRGAVPERVNALEARRNELLRPMPKQPPFDPTIVRKTGHTDPHIGYNIKFAENN